MNKAFLVWLLAVFFFATVNSTHAQPSKKVWRIGYLSGVDRATDAPRSEELRRALRELGYLEGQNLAFEYRHAEGTIDRQGELAAELVRQKVDLILVAGGDNGIRAAMKATKSTPIIMSGLGSDPVRAGFIESLARPGGNVTGLTSLGRELGGKRLELFKEAVPKLARVAVLYQPSIPGTAREVKEDLPAAARALGLTLQPWEVPDAASFDKRFAGLSSDRPDGLYSPGGGTLIRTRLKRISDFALKHRIPLFDTYKEAVEAGSLMYYGADIADGYKRVAYFIDRILKGTKPADLPVEQPTKFEFVINLKTAKQIGLNIPAEVLARATRVLR